MLVVNPLGSVAGRYYRDGESPGTWRGSGAAALGLEGAVRPEVLERLLGGHHPDDGTELLDRRHPHRRAGWDLVLAAPKSVSVLAGLAPPPRAESMGGAHASAVDDALSWLEERACWARRDGRLVAGEGLLAARFDHRRSALGEPHLHAHVVVPNLVRTPDRRWSALDGSSLWLHRRALSAIYDLALRHHLGRQGLSAGWDLHPDGTWDVARVPRAAIDATSTRGGEVRRSLGGDETTRRARRAARVLTRSDEAEPPFGDLPAVPSRHWWSAVGAAGLGPAQAAEINLPRVEPSGPWRVPDATARQAGESGVRFDRAEPAAVVGARRPTHDPDVLAGAVEARLISRSSDWTGRDVLVALAATAATGATPAAAEAWAQGFTRACIPSGDGGRLTTPAAGDLDRAVLELARRAPKGIGIAAPDALQAALSRRPGLGAASVAAVRRLTGAGHGVDVLGVPAPDGNPRGRPGGSQERCEAFVAQAAVLDAAREAWAATGCHVVVVATGPAASRWAALAALAPAPPGSPGVPIGPDGTRTGLDHRPAGVLVVDRADRLPPAQLRELLEDASTIPAKVVLVRGGTLPALHTATCQGLEAIDAELGHAAPSPRAPGPAGDLEVALPVLTTGAALERIASLWQERGSSFHLVGLGPAEVGELNRRAREVLRAAGQIHGPDIELAGRRFAIGDQVIPLRREAGAPGSVGVVIGADPGTSQRPVRVTVDWDGTERNLDAWSARHVGHGYALTPAGLRLRPGPALLLGEPATVGRASRSIEMALCVGGPDPGHGTDRAPAPALGHEHHAGPSRWTSLEPAAPPEPSGLVPHRGPWRRDPGRAAPERGLGL